MRTEGAAQRPRVGLALIGLLWLVTACYAWSAPNEPPAEYLSANHPAELRVSLTDGTDIELLSPVIESDSIIGTQVLGEEDIRRVAVPLDAISQIRARSVSTARTLLAIGVPVAAVLTFRLAREVQ